VGVQVFTVSLTKGINRMRLLLSQKNQLFKIIEDSKFLSPGQFSLTEPRHGDDNSFSIKLKNSDYIFTILENIRYVKSFYVNYIPGIDVYMEISGDLNWGGIVEQFCRWIDNVSRELNEPNHWARLEHEVSNIDFSTNFDNSKFSVRDYEELKSKIEVISQNISSIPLLLDQQREIRLELERLTELAKDLGKVDWLNLFIGTIISIIIQLSVTKENAAMLWTLIKTTFNIYFLK
jgi:hypothetical protein